MDAELNGYLDAWRSATGDVTTLLRELTPQEWELPTDLPGWNVRYVAGHLAHLESDLAGFPQEQVEVPEADHVKGLMDQFTEAGPIARANWTTAAIIEEFERAVTTRDQALQSDPPDPDAIAGGFAALVGWSWRTLLSNRALDVWMHDQDIRRAVNRPDGLQGPGAAHTAAVCARSWPYVVGKRAGAPSGTTAVLEVVGPQARTLAAHVGEDGRARPVDPAAGSGSSAVPEVVVRLDFEDWIALSGGRRSPDATGARIEGDQALGAAILAGMTITP